jgi:4-hydroxy-4-methyl-2-oxoglutarate aldolase
MNNRPTAQQLEKLKLLGAATVHEAQGQKGALDVGIKPLDPSLRLAGPALTIDARPSDNLIIHYAMTKARPGDVLVVDAKSFLEAGPWGDVLTLAAQQLGIAGLIIDGSVRDAASIIEMRFPVFARGLSVKGTNKHQPGRINVPIICGGVAINPGDVIVGDRDGVVVVDSREIEAVIAASQERESTEDKMREDIRAGKSTVELLGLQGVLQKFGLN